MICWHGKDMTQPIAAIILAAGKGTRMKSDLPKVLHPLAGRPLLAHVLDLAQCLEAGRVVAVVGHQAERVQETFAGRPNLRFALIDSVDIPKGAVREATPHGDNYDVTIWSVVGDTQRLRYYFRTYDNKNWFMVDVARALADAKGPASIPVGMQPSYADVTGTARPAQ